MLKSHNRYSYSPIVDRLDFSWPNEKRLAVYFTISLECFSFGEGGGVELRPAGGHQPDVVNFTWRDYGVRVGIWRMLELFEEFNIPFSLLLNSEIYSYAPGLMDVLRSKAVEIIGHGKTNSFKQGALPEEEERKYIQETQEEIKKHSRVETKGWLGPALSESFVTPDLLQEEGFEYILEWGFDDQPIWLKTRKGQILSIPLSQEINDLACIIGRQQSVQTYNDMVMDQFDEMERQSAQQSLVLGIPMHPFVMGQPFRLVYLRQILTYVSKLNQSIWLTHPGAINNYFKTL
jgi:peptidoglycan/xylan/chitin deacetylase (PgdA/CDA1 family)